MNLIKNEFEMQFMDKIKTEIDLESNQKFDKNIAFSQNSNELSFNNNNNNNNSNNDLDSDLSSYYESFVLNSIEWFVCKYSDCEQTDRSETQMIEHLRQHLMTDNKSVESKPKIDSITKEVILSNSDSIDDNVIERKGNIKTSDDSALDSSEDMNDLSLYISIRETDGKLFCKWNDCRFESNQKSCITRHVLNRHLNPKQTNPFEQIDTYNESKYWDKIMNSNKDWLQRSHSKNAQTLPPLPSLASPEVPSLPEPPLLTPFNAELTAQLTAQTSNQMFIDDKQWLERMSSIASLQTISSQNSSKCFDNKSINGFNDSFEEKDVLMKNHLNISNNEENILLSCKGLASMSKVKDYYEIHVINGEKVFSCKFPLQVGKNGSSPEVTNRCQFRTKKSQKIAQHINLTHIGVEFRCNKPNCYKVFKNPNTYREHQKNHICGFGIFGYGSKGVIGVCRNESLNQYRERVIIDSKKFYRCKWNGTCNAITRYHMAMKRHIHNHVCPYRVNLKLKQNQDVINDIKSETWNLDLGLGSIPMPDMMDMPDMPDLSIASTSSSQPNGTDSADSVLNNNKTYQCRRIKCMASFSSNADLVKHENSLCKQIKTNNNSNNSDNNLIINHKKVGQKAVDIKPTLSIEEVFGNGVQPIEQIVRKAIVSQINGNKVQNNSNSNLSNVQIMTNNIEKYFCTKEMNGVDYHLCIWNGPNGKCKFTSKLLRKTIDHIQEQHFGLESQLNLSSDFMQNCTKRVRNSTESPETDSSKENSSKKRKTIEIVVNKSGNSLINEQKLVANMSSETEPNVCDIENCGKQFRTAFALSQHKVNHICGFNIKGRKSSGVCDLENIRKYREEIVIENRFIYSCKFYGCNQYFENRSIVLSHIHNRHICPNRLAANGPESVTFAADLVQTIIETNGKKSNENQKFKSNLNSIEIIEI